MELAAVALALSLLAIILSLPALFLAVYCLVSIKAREISADISDTDRQYSRDPVGSRSLMTDGYERGPGMYDIEEQDEGNEDFFEDSQI